MRLEDSWHERREHAGRDQGDSCAFTLKPFPKLMDRGRPNLTQRLDFICGRFRKSVSQQRRSTSLRPGSSDPSGLYGVTSHPGTHNVAVFMAMSSRVEQLYSKSGILMGLETDSAFSCSHTKFL